MKKREENKKKKLIIIIVLFFTLFIGIGYAVLTELLTFDGTIKYGEMKWNIGFSEASNGAGTVSSNPQLSEDKKTITVTCNVGTSTASETCIAKATIKNDSTFNIKLSKDPTVAFEDTYIKSVDVIWTEDSTDIKADDTVDAGKDKEVQITITTKEITNTLIPTDNISVPVTVTLDWIENDK